MPMQKQIENKTESAIIKFVFKLIPHTHTH